MRGSAAALAALLLALVPGTAKAATYEVRLCADPLDTGFVASNANPDVLSVTSTCPPAANDPFSGVFAGVKPGTTAIARDTAAGWTLTAPTGTAFEEVTVRRHLRKVDSDYEVAVVKADGSIVDGCVRGVTCWEEVATRSYGRTTQLTFRVRCAAATCGNSIQGPRAWMSIETARATIEDPAPPVVAAPTSEPKWQRAATVTVSASDASGIATLSLRSGQKTLGTTELACDDRHLRPCPETATAAIAVDLPDGSHELTAVATDAAAQPGTSTVELKLDRAAPASPANVTVRPTGTGMYAYAWTNPDQGQAAPIVAAHLSGGTVVRGANIQQLESASPVERIHLEDEAGNADPATAAGPSVGAPLQFRDPILQSTATPRVKVSSAKRNGTRLVVRGSVTNATATRVTATLTRGKRSARKSVTLSKGRFTIRIPLSAALRRTGTATLTVKHGAVKTTKRLRF